jgi:type I restriction enzyme S subunit
MIDALKPYPVMKDSGVPWLGEVPEHWEVRRLKHAFRKIVGGSTPASTEPIYWDGDVVWVTPADISRTARLATSLRRITREGLRSCSSELVPPGSIVVTSRAPVGNVAIAETELCTNQGCKALVATAAVVNPVFGFHVLTTLKGELQSLATGTTFTEISTSRLCAVAIPLPPLPEQAAIVRFLDYADRRIRRYIRAKQKLIELLEEQKQAIIHRAVTRGLDPNVRLKPSGVEWLGDVPEHWDVRP